MRWPGGCHQAGPPPRRQHCARAASPDRVERVRRLVWRARRGGRLGSRAESGRHQERQAPPALPARITQSVGFLIDTDIWVAVERGTLAPADIHAFTGAEPIFLSPVNVAELQMGIDLVDDEATRRKAMAAMRRLRRK